MIIQILNTINDDIKQIRTDVFMKEQGFENEFDEIDETAKFVLLSIDGKAVGTCRFFPSDIEGDAHIGRMAVRKLYRGQNLGSKIMLAAENGIRRDGFKTCSLSAQVQVKPFYESLGYVDSLHQGILPLQHDSQGIRKTLLPVLAPTRSKS